MGVGAVLDHNAFAYLSLLHARAALQRAEASPRWSRTLRGVCSPSPITGACQDVSQLAELKQSDSDFPNIEMDRHKEFWDAIRLAHGRKSQLPKSREIGSLTVKSDVQPALLGRHGYLDRRHPVDQPEHAVGKGESPDRRDGEGDELL